MPVLAGGACRVVEVFEAGSLAEAVLAPLSVALACFGVVFFFEAVAPESGADCEAETPPSAFSLFLSFLAVLESLWFWSPVYCAGCAQAEAVPTASKKAPSRVMCVLLIIPILKLPLRVWRLIFLGGISA